MRNFQKENSMDKETDPKTDEYLGMFISLIAAIKSQSVDEAVWKFADLAEFDFDVSRSSIETRIIQDREYAKKLAYVIADMSDALMEFPEDKSDELNWRLDGISAVSSQMDVTGPAGSIIADLLQDRVRESLTTMNVKLD
jgi:hypothetical protein